MRPSPPRYPLVAFDYDGTLADSFDWFAGVLDDVAERYRFRRVGADEAEELRGLDARAIVARLGIPAWKLPLIARHMHRLAARDGGVRPFPGVAPMLAQLEAGGVRLALVSSNAEANVRAVLGPETAGRFERIACGAALFGKARRLRALARATGLAPAEILMVGDEIRDADAAREAGCAFAAVAWGYTRPAALAACEPVALFERPEAIPGFLGLAPEGYIPLRAPGTGEAALLLPNGS